MINDEQRSEVAALLRKEADNWVKDCPDTVTCKDYDYYEFILNIADAADIDLSKPPSMLFNRLADLIDRPAVKPVRPYDDMPDYVFCGECNTQIWNSANYCPQCGTRCVPYSEPFFDDEDRRTYETICGDV